MKISKGLYEYLTNGKNKIQDMVKDEDFRKTLSDSEFVTASEVIRHLCGMGWVRTKESKCSTEEGKAILDNLKIYREKYLNEVQSIIRKKYEEDYSNVLKRYQPKKSFISRILSSIIPLDHDRENRLYEKNDFIEIDSKSEEFKALESKYRRIKYDVVLDLYGLDVGTKEKVDMVKEYIKSNFPESQLPNNNYEHNLPDVFIEKFGQFFEGYFLLKNLHKKRPDLIDENLLKVISEALYERYTEIITKIENNTFKYTSERYFELLKIFKIKYVPSVDEVMREELIKYTGFISKEGKEDNKSIFLSNNRLRISDYKVVNLALNLDIGATERFFINLKNSIDNQNTIPAKNVKNIFEEISLMSDFSGLEFKLKDKTKFKIVEEFKNLIDIVFNEGDFNEIMSVGLSLLKTEEQKINEAITERANFLTEGLLIIMNDIVKRDGDLKDINKRIYKQEIVQLLSEAKEKSRDRINDKQNSLKV